MGTVDIIFIIVRVLCVFVVSIQLLRLSNEPQSPVMHLYLASSSGSRDQDVTLLRKIVALVSLFDSQIKVRFFHSKLISR